MNNYYLFDLDDTICRLAIPLQNALNMATNKDIHWKSWTGHELEKIYNISTDDFIEIMISGHVIEQALPITNVKSILEKLKDMGYGIHICSKRAWHPNALAITKEWFQDFGLPYDSINIIGLNESKPDIMRKIGNKCLIDDQIHNCKMAIDEGFEAKLIRMPWHSNDIDIPMINHLEDIVIL